MHPFSHLARAEEFWADWRERWFLRLIRGFETSQEEVSSLRDRRAYLSAIAPSLPFSNPHHHDEIGKNARRYSTKVDNLIKSFHIHTPTPHHPHRPQKKERKKKEGKVMQGIFLTKLPRPLRLDNPPIL